MLWKRTADAINSNESSWDETYRIALARRKFAELCANHPDDVTDEDAAAIMDECNLPEECISLKWYEKLQADHVAECRKALGDGSEHIQTLRLQVQSQADRLKALKGTLEEAQERLRELSEIISHPKIPDLPPIPNRQREFAMDGEEWRLVPMNEVLKDKPKLRAVVEKKLGNITLGAWADKCARWQEKGGHEVTIKQFEAITEEVERWHAANSDDTEESEAAE